MIDRALLVDFFLSHIKAWACDGRRRGMAVSRLLLFLSCFDKLGNLVANLVIVTYLLEIHTRHLAF